MRGEVVTRQKEAARGGEDLRTKDQRKFGQMSAGAWLIYAINKAVVRALGPLGRAGEKGFFGWQKLVSVLGPHLTGRTYYGASLNCDIHDFIMKRIFFFNIWEPSVSKAISDILQAGDVFVDVGANIGYDSLLASKLVGDGGQVVAIEANSSIFRQLQDNLARNGVSNVRTIRAAAGDKKGKLTLHGGDAGNQGRTSPLPRRGLQPIETVQMLPLDEILTEGERARLRLIKIDIEGGELPVLQRLLKTLDLYSTGLHLIVEMSDEETGAVEAIFKSLVSTGYATFGIENDYSIAAYLRSVDPADPRSISDLPRHQTDVLFVPISAPR